jgi:hypothetical protein
MLETYPTVVIDCEGHKYQLSDIQEQLIVTPLDDDEYSVNKKDFSDFEKYVYNFLYGM